MLNEELFAKVLELFRELDGSDYAREPKVTRACIAALLERMVNSLKAHDDLPTEEDTARAVHDLARLVEDEADRVRQVIRREEC